MIKRVCYSEKTVLTFDVMPPLYLPFFNKWSANAYYTYEPFSYDPFTIRASSSSGSPIVIAGNKFFGFMNETGGRFAYDGKYTLSVTVEAGQELWINENCEPFEQWQQYSQAVIAALPESYPKKEFFSQIEYCTWVEQKRQAVIRGKSNMWCCLNEKFVYDSEAEGWLSMCFPAA